MATPRAPACSARLLLGAAVLASIGGCAAREGSPPATEGPQPGGAGAASGFAAGDTVRVAGGLLAGTRSSDARVRTFRGIPFAAPPVGELRWRPPQPPPAWSGVRNADRFGPRCMQRPVFGDMVFRSNGMSEDCLYLNVWTSAAAADARLPVLVYFYGGGMIAGDGSELRYDGESLARRGLVVVTTNYRLDVFGLLAHPALTAESTRHASGNYAFLDQVAALRWVRRNIAAFGGDPERVTIGGESAGSISVSALMTSPLSRDLLAGAIGESGAMIRPTSAPVPLADAEAKGEAFARALGTTSLAELRRVPADSLLRATGQPGVGGFPPVVDGFFLPRPPAEILASGDQAAIPLLVGWNTEEGGWRAILGTDEPSPARYDSVVRQVLGDSTDALLRLLPGGTPEQVMESATFLAGARFISFSTWKWAQLHGRTGGDAPVYRYLFARPRPPGRTEEAPPPARGAVHSSEIEYALGNLATNEVYAWTAEDHALSELMQTYFANFVKTGDPNQPGGTGLPRWPRAFAGDTVRVMRLDVNAGAEPAPHDDAFRFLEPFFLRGAR